MSEPEQRSVPHSQEAEAGALGAILTDALKLMPLAQSRYRIDTEAFYVQAHQCVWDAMVDMETAGKAIDSLTVCEWMEKTGTLSRSGGSAFVAGLVDACPTAAHGEYYLDLVRKHWEMRQVIQACRDGEIKARDAETAAAVISVVQEKFAAVGGLADNEVANDQVMAGILQSWRDASDGKQPAIGLTLPWDRVTRTMCGLDEGIIIVAGRPSAGKTTFEDAVALHVAENGIPVGRVTLDSTRRQLLGRSICRIAGVSMPKMRFGFGTRAQHAAAVGAAADITQLPIYFNDRDTDIAQICAWARLQKRKHGIGLLTVDYIQLIGASCMGRQEWDTVARVTYVSRTLKALAYELGIPVLLLSQLSRLMEQENREPKLSDLRDSGAIEQDANKVMFVYVDQKKRKEMEGKSRGATKHKRPVWLNVMKHKDGETGSVPMWLYPPYFRFAECDMSAEAFSDDDLPADSHRDQKEFEAKPEYFPDEEGVARAKKATQVEEQFALPVEGDET